MQNQSLVVWSVTSSKKAAFPSMGRLKLSLMCACSSPLHLQIAVALQNAFRSTVSSPKDKLLLKGHDLYACWNVSLAWSGLFTVWKISCTTTQWHYSMVSYYIFSHISVSRDNGSLFVTYVSPAEMNYGDRGGWAQAGQKTVALPELQFWSLSSGMPPPGLSERVRPCPSNQHWYPLSN